MTLGAEWSSLVALLKRSRRREARCVVFSAILNKHRGKSCKITRQIKSIKASHYKCIRLGMNLRMRLHTRIHSDPSPNSSWKSSLASSRPWSRAVLCHRHKWLQLGIVGKLHVLDARNSQFWIWCKIIFQENISSHAKDQTIRSVYSKYSRCY